MDAHPVAFEVDGLVLKGTWSPGRERAGVVLAHPHPQYGGNRENSVVKAAERAFQAVGWHTLRFDFRGAGESEGHFDDGIGEVRDLLAACEFLEPHVGRLGICGYSFGAWIATAAVAQGLLCERLVLIAPPLGLLPFNARLGLPSLTHVIGASDDMFAPPDAICEAAGHWNSDARLDILGGADHFFSGKEALVTARILESLQQA